MANFNDRLTKLETAVASIMEKLWEMDNEPLVPDDGEMDDAESSEIAKLRQQIELLEIQRQNILNNGEIEHRLYEIELRDNKTVIDRKTICMPENRASWYALYGYQIFDYTEKLDLDPMFYDEEKELVLG